MIVSNTGIELIKRFEGLRLKAYKDAVGIWTIGYGITRYPNDGSVVRAGESITIEMAYQLLEFTVHTFAGNVDKLVTSSLNQNQFDSLVSFAYNVGVGNFKKSTLLKKVNVKPCDETIRIEFLKWNKAGGRVLKGLTLRRQAEADLFFKITSK